jgi:hypothetical protein
MADKQVTVAVPEERVPEFYSWFAAFLEATPGSPPPFRGRGRRGRFGPRHHGEAQAWSAQDGDQAKWLYGKLAPPARALFDILLDAQGDPIAGEEIAKRLDLDKGAHGVAGILAWPGRYSRHIGRVLPISTEGRADGGTDYLMEPEPLRLFTAAREATRTGGRKRTL